MKSFTTVGKTLQMLLKEFEDFSLDFLSTAMGDVPKFGFELVVSALTLPCIVHGFEGFVHTSYGEELVLRAIDEKHRFGTSDTGDMRVVEPATQAREAVGKASILCTTVFKTHLLVGSHHPTDGSPDFDPV